MIYYIKEQGNLLSEILLTIKYLLIDLNLSKLWELNLREFKI